MEHLNVEFKAPCEDLPRARETLVALGAVPQGIDHQIDTYFRVPHGRLKLREGTIERNLIQYHRPDVTGPRRSDVTLVPAGASGDALKVALTRALGILVVVDKRREILWLDNVKLHLDEVKGLGTFLEVEAIAHDGHTEGDLHVQCRHLLTALAIDPATTIPGSYSDALLANAGPPPPA